VQRLEAIWRGLERRHVLPITWRSMLGATDLLGGSLVKLSWPISSVAAARPRC
jgi:hypothetical protein